MREKQTAARTAGLSATGGQAAGGGLSRPRLVLPEEPHAVDAAARAEPDLAPKLLPEEAPPSADPVEDVIRREQRAAGWRGLRLGLRIAAILSVITIVLIVGALVLAGRSLALPPWAVARVESRLNAGIGQTHLPPGTTIALGGIDLALERDLTPRLTLRELRLIEAGGQAVVALPEARVTLDGLALLRGRPQVSTLRLVGARLAIGRDAEGRIALNFAGFSGAPNVQTLPEMLDSLDRMFQSPALAGLKVIEGSALSLSLQDERAGRSWEVGDGRLVIENRPQSVAAELGMTLLDGASPAQIKVSLETNKNDSSARMWATVDQIAAADLAEQAAPFAILRLIDAPISGQIVGRLDESGAPGGFEGSLTLGPGEVRPVEGGRPVILEQAGVSLRYDPERQRVTMDRLSVESPSLRLVARGTGDLLDLEGQTAAPGRLPETIVSQLSLSEVMVDPEGLFESPVRFSSGVAEARIQLEPFRVDFGQILLQEGDENLRLSGHLGMAEKGGWQGAIDVSLNRIGAERLLKLWPLVAVPKTRDWLAKNVGQAELHNVDAALRIFPDREPRFALDYDFSGAEVRFIRTLPPIEDGRGRASILGNVYSLYVDSGHVTAPEGGRIRVDGSMFQVLDILEKPAQAEVLLMTDASLTATLSLLDQEPFRFVSKAKRQVNMGEGRARLKTVLRFPLVARITPEMVSYAVEGELSGVTSDKIVPGRRLTSDSMKVEVSPRGMILNGTAEVAGVPFTGRLEQAFGKAAGGKARVTGRARLSDAGLRRLGVELPQGWLKGETGADVILDLQPGQPTRLALTSDLKGSTLALPELGWSKAAGTGGKLKLSALLSERPEVPELRLEAAGLAAEGRLTLRPRGEGLDRLTLSRLTLGRWMDVKAELAGRGKGQPPAIRITGGRIDLRQLPGARGEKNAAGPGGGRGTPIDLRLERLDITDSVAFTAVNGQITPQGAGLSGSLTGGVNGIGRVNATLAPYGSGTAVRLRSQDAGRVLAAAGIFGKGRGGALDVTIQPEGSGRYLGKARVTGFSLLGAPVLAELLSAASIVGLLEQLNGNGIQFTEADVLFRIAPTGVQILQGAAIGASVGISFEGYYHNKSASIDLQGTISPIYLLNGIGQIFARKGEGLFGFNYRMWGPVKSPAVSVNPLSILTPGMFREIFRRPPPVLEGPG